MTPSRQFLRFAAVGVVAAVVHYGTLIALVESGGMAPVAASLVAFVAGGVASYILNRRFTFVSRRSHGHAVPRFATVAGGGFVITGLLMYVLVDHARLPYIPAQLATTGAVLVWTFLLNRHWTFVVAEEAEPR